VSETSGSVLTLSAGGKRHGLPSRMIREVARLPRLTRVPHAPAEMLGLANLRGTVMPVLSLAALLGGSAGAEQRLVVLDAGEPVGLAVDVVTDMLDARQAEAASIEPLDVLSLLASHATADVGKRAQGRANADLEGAAREDVAEKTASLVTFAIGAQTFALPLDTVDEVLRLPLEITAVPNAEAMVLGSMDLRGAVLPLLMLAPLLALPGEALSAKSRVLVVRIGEQRVGFVVDALGAVLRVPVGTIDPVPIVLTRGEAEARIQAVCRLGEGRLVSVLAAEHLLRDDITARLVKDSSTRRKEVQVHAEPTEPFVVFRICDAIFGLPSFAVEHVGTLPSKLARVPRSAAFVRGAMPWRGEAIPVIDQSKRFGAVTASAARQRVVVVAMGSLRAAFAVDAVIGLHAIAQSALRTIPEAGSLATRLFNRVSTGEDPQQLTLLLDPEQLLDGTERDMLQSERPAETHRS
jgi:purine-binding chemotaxis protein CheW